MAVSGDQWPVLVYADGVYDLEDPWSGLFRARLLVWVKTFLLLFIDILIFLLFTGIQTHLHITQFSRERAKGNAIRQCTHSRYDLCHYSLHSLHSNSGYLPKLSINLIY